MKHRNILLIVLIAGLFASCKKDHVNITGIPQQKTKQLIKESSSGYYNNDTYFSYDAAGRLAESKDQSDDFKFTNSGNILHITDYRQSENREVLNLAGALNNGSLPPNMSGNISYNQNSPYTADIAYDYTADGRLMSRTEHRSSNHVYKKMYTYNSTDLLRRDDYSDGTLSIYWVYEYTDIIDKTGLSLTNFDTFTDAVFGKVSTHLPKKLTIYLGGTNAVLSTTQYTYEMDSDGYPAKAYVDWGGQFSTVVYSYNN